MALADMALAGKATAISEHRALYKNLAQINKHPYLLFRAPIIEKSR